MSASNSGTYAVVWPRSAKSVEVKPLSPRLTDLSGKTIAFLWDYLFRGDEIWPILSEELSARHPGMRFIGWEEFGSTHGDQEHKVLAELPAKLKALKVDAVVSGMGC
jgi:hypothetical protein